MKRSAIAQVSASRDRLEPCHHLRLIQREHLNLVSRLSHRSLHLRADSILNKRMKELQGSETKN